MRKTLWTVDDEDPLRKLLAAGVMGVTIRKPVLALKLRDEIQKGSPTMKFVTFNIRCDWGQDGENCFDNRKPLILKKLAAEQPDILCFQEVRPHQALWLKENLTDYMVIGCGRDALLGGEQMTVAFKKDRYNLIEMRTFWLSETPYVPGSRYAEQSDCPRACTEAVLMEYETDKVFRVLNTHLDHIGAGARKLGLKQILKHLGEVRLFPDAPTILCGDFNAWPDGEEMKVFDDYPEYVNATEGIGVTYHGYMKAAHPECIDYIFLKGAVSCTKVEKWTDSEAGVFLSDHYPVCAELTLG